MAIVALLSNPHSTGNRSQLPAMRSFCAANPEIFHYEVEEAGQIGRALASIAQVKPRVLVINGGDGTVQTTLTELYHGGHFDGAPPPVAVLPNGKTNLIALDLGAQGDPIVALQKIVEIARGNMAPHIVERELIALSDGSDQGRPVLGMFLGGAGLAEVILYCRQRIYPLGLPNGISHVLTAIVALMAFMLGLKARFLPSPGGAMRISHVRDGVLQGQFAVLIVTTLEKLLLGGTAGARGGRGQLRMMAIDRSPRTLLRALIGSLRGRLGNAPIKGVHLSQGDMIRIEGERSSVILDGEIYQADRDHPIVLRSTDPVPFLKLAA